ncbi:hypothetical protein Bca4012_068553 [Brassica carinata]
MDVLISFADLAPYCRPEVTSLGSSSTTSSRFDCYFAVLYIVMLRECWRHYTRRKQTSIR